MYYTENIPEYLSKELDTSRWGDCEVLDDIDCGKFVITQPTFVNKSTESGDDTSSVSSVNSEDEWTNIEKKEKKVYKKCKQIKENTEFSRGVIKKWNADKGYGFVSFDYTNQKLNDDIKNLTKKDVFIHMSQFNVSPKYLNVKKGYTIEYVLIYDKELKKPQAFKANVLKKN